MVVVLKSALIVRSVFDNRNGFQLTPLIRKTQPLHQEDRAQGHLGLAEIEHRTKSAEGRVRHPFFRGIREDL
jgi:bifunctional non-homologous end joining protein LigD